MSSLRSGFNDNGYVVVKSFLDSNEVKELQLETNRFVREEVPRLPKEDVYYENKDDASTLKQVQRLYEYDEYFMRLGSSSKVVGLAEDLLDGAVTLQNMQYFNKIPHVGQATPVHQDGYYFMITPQNALTMWLSLGQADASNGAVRYIPGSHKKGVLPHVASGTLGFSQEITDWSEKDDFAFVQMEASAGDMLVHHSLTIHGANKNESDRDRKSIGFIFYRDDVEIDTKAHTTYRKELHNLLRKKRKF